MINLDEVGAFGSIDPSGNLIVRFGLYLPGIRSADGFEVIVKIIHRDDRFDPQIPTQDFSLAWQNGHPLDLWTQTLTIQVVPGTHFGQEGTYLYRYQLWWTPPGGSRQLLTRWFTDPFARATDIGDLSAFLLARAKTPFNWTDAAYKTLELDDLVVYELQVEEFNGTFAGVVDRLSYLQSLGINCLELMPVTSVKLDFDWGYGPLHYFAPHARFGGPGGLKRLVEACHAEGLAVILDVVYQHVDPTFPYKLVYDDVNATNGAPKVPNPMIGASGPFGPQADFSQPSPRNTTPPPIASGWTNTMSMGFAMMKSQISIPDPLTMLMPNWHMKPISIPWGFPGSNKAPAVTAASSSAPKRYPRHGTYYEIPTRVAPGKMNY